MATIHVHPNAPVDGIRQMAARLGLTPAVEHGRLVLQTPNQGNTNVVRIPRYRHQFGPDFHPEPPAAA